ncbi:unnamed protein product [Echinostoma caproni]|uniref:Lig_chan-Glu_bd domain-containing protein n=1 Tax=Echinostoma caproni TaxID=27848 RepID=A0A183A7L4_9TREM|nr:unnamed protein product [Echinostoma caproni]
MVEHHENIMQGASLGTWLFLLAFCTQQSETKELLVGIIYDEHFDNSIFPLESALQNISRVLPRLTLKIMMSQSGKVAPKLTFLVRPYGLNEVCKMMSSNVRLIISLTSCVVARLIEVTTSKHRLIHVAIAQPMCPDIDWDEKGNETTTIWIQPRPDYVALMLKKLAQMEKPHRGIILTNGPTSTPARMLLALSQSALGGRYSQDIYPSKVYSLNRGRDRTIYPTLPGTPSLDTVLFELGGNHTCGEVTTYAYIFTAEPHIQHELNTIAQHERLFMKHVWIFAERLEMPVAKVIKALPANITQYINMGFIRYTPYLNDEDWTMALQWLPQDIREKHRIDLLDIPERVLWIMKSVFIFIWARLINEHHDDVKPLDCYKAPHNIYDRGVITRNWMKEVFESSFDSYKFYSLQVLENGTKQFRATADLSTTGKLTLTPLGDRILQKTIISGLFANQFHGFPDREIRAGVIEEEPLVIGGTRLTDGVLVNATGMIIDMLDILSEKFSFRYKVVLSSDGLFGTQEENKSWSGLIGDLIDKSIANIVHPLMLQGPSIDRMTAALVTTVEKMTTFECLTFQRIDLIATPLTVTEERSKVIHFLTSFMDDSVGILVSPSTSNSGMFLVVRPFSPGVWILLIVSSFVAGSVAFMFWRFNLMTRERSNQTHVDRPSQSLSDIIWNYIQCFLFRSAERIPTINSGRIVLMLFWTLIILMHSFWQADITAHLTKEVVQVPINTLEELAAHKKMQPLLIRGTAIYSMFQHAAPGTPYQRIFEKYLAHGRQAWNMSAAIDLLFGDPQLALVGDVHLLRHAVNNHCGRLVLSDRYEWHSNLGFATLPKVSFSPPLTKYMNYYLVLLLSGFIGGVICQEVDMIRVGVIYDEYFDKDQFDLEVALNSYLPIMSYVLEQSFTNGSSYESPEWVLTVRKFSLEEVCSLIELGARMIASLTSCSVAQYIDSITSRHHILHFAIPRPMCLERPSVPNGDIMHTIWYQPDTQNLANALYQINEFENAGRGLILSNGQSSLPKILLEMSSEAISLGRKFKPIYVTQDFATVDDEKSGFPGTSTDRISLDSILNALADTTGTSSGAPSLSHVIVMAPRSGVLEVLDKLVLYSSVAKKYMWIFGEPIDIPIKTMLKLLSAHPIKTMNVAFFRYLPILHQEDCNDDSMNKLLRDTAIHFGSCDYSPLPLGILHRWSALAFYALETDTQNTTRFVNTAHYADGQISLTTDGAIVAEQALVSGLFPNRFRNFTNNMLTVGMVLIPPFVMDYEISTYGYVTKARGMMIDLLDILAQRFYFRYRIYPARDGHFGEFSLRGEWTGLIGDLQAKRIDLAASCLLQNKKRDELGAFLGHVLDGRIAILVAKPTTEGKLFQVFQIYQPYVLAMFLFTALVTTGLIYVYDRFSPYSSRNQTPPEEPISEYSYFIESLWNIFKCSFGRSMLQCPINPSSRAMCLVYWTIVTLLFIAWQADITSYLTRTNYKPPVQSLAELAADTTLKPLIIRGTGIKEFFEESNTQPVYQEVLRRIIDDNLIVPNTSVAISKVLDDSSYVVVGDYETLRYAQLSYCKKLLVVNTGVSMGQQSLMALKDVDWVKPFSTYLGQLKENGIIDALSKRWWDLNSVCTVGALNYRSLDLQALEELFILLSAFIGMAVLFLCLEWLWSGVIWVQIKRRLEKKAARRARLERRMRRANASEGEKQQQPNDDDEAIDLDDSESSGLEDLE